MHLRLVNRGFTLIEILVVIVVIGVLVSIFTLSVSGFAEDQGLEDARRLSTLIELASEEAVMQGREYGLTFYRQGYEFSVREVLRDEDGKLYARWAVLEQDRLLRPRRLAEELELDLEIDGDEVQLLYERDADAEYEPQVYLLSSGEIEPPFVVRIRPGFQNIGVVLNVTADAAVNIVDENADNP